MRVLAVVGSGRESGKTLTVEALTRELSGRGYRVCTIKQIHEEDFTIDTKGKDTWRHAEAGATAVVAAAPKEVSLIMRIEGDRYRKALELLKCVGPDVVIVEGDPQVDVPKILACADERAARELISKHTSAICVSSTSSNSPKAKLRTLHPLKDAKEMADIAAKALGL